MPSSRLIANFVHCFIRFRLLSSQPCQLSLSIGQLSKCSLFWRNFPKRGLCFSSSGPFEHTVVLNDIIANLHRPQFKSIVLQSKFFHISFSRFFLPLLIYNQFFSLLILSIFNSSIFFFQTITSNMSYGGYPTLPPPEGNSMFVFFSFISSIF